MPYSHTFTTPQGAHIAIWRLTEDLPTLLALWGDAALPAHYYKATAEKRRREIVATALLMRQHYGCDVTLQHAANGAPIVEDGEISISHSATHIAIATHDTRRVGVDIETIGNRAERVMSRFMAPQEIAALPTDAIEIATNITQRCAAIHMIWSVKEAVFKIHPTAVEFCEDIILTPITHLPSGVTTAQLTACNITLQAQYTIHEGCSLAWVVE